MLVGLETPDDAGVVRLSDTLALVTTTDFFTPVVDDARTYGRIAATNALSDVYAMGGEPIAALNIVCFPSGSLDASVLHDILAGGLDALRLAHCPLVGGHSVDDPELKYGLAVTGTVHPVRFLTTRGARAGDVLVLTKPLGTGLIGTAVKRGKASVEAIEGSVHSMTTLNAAAARLMFELGAHACTDVTGFGLVGHASEMVAETSLDLEIAAPALPLLPDALALAATGMACGGLGRNRDHYAPIVDLDGAIGEPMRHLVFDPQTSGGLLIALSQDTARELLRRLDGDDHPAAAAIGRVTRGTGRVRVVAVDPS